MANMNYRLRYDVPAETGARAIMAATELLRQNVTVERASAEASFPGWFEVTFDLREDEPEQCDAVTAAKAWADR